MAAAVQLIEALTLLTILGVIMMTTFVVVVAVRVFRFVLFIGKVIHKHKQFERQHLCVCAFDFCCSPWR